MGEGAWATLGRALALPREVRAWVAWDGEGAGGGREVRQVLGYWSHSQGREDRRAGVARD